MVMVWKKIRRKPLNIVCVLPRWETQELSAAWVYIMNAEKLCPEMLLKRSIGSKSQLKVGTAMDNMIWGFAIYMEEV